MSRHRTWILLFILAAAARLLTQGWDSGLLSPHPDERQVAFVAAKTTHWLSDPGFYAYGALHFQAVRAFTSLLGEPATYRGLLLGGRGLSLFASLLALAIGFLLAEKAWGERTAAAFLMLAALVPLDLQQSHFATVEAHHAAWVMLALAACWWLAQTGGTAAAALAGVAVGASLAVKISSIGLVVPLAVAVALVMRRRGAVRAASLTAVLLAGALASFWIGEPWAFAKADPPLALVAGLIVAAIVLAWTERTRRTAVGGWIGAFTALAGAAATYAWGPWINPSWLAGVGAQVAMVTGRADLPYVRVYRHTPAILYPLGQLAMWGLGPALVLAVLGAGGAGAWWSVRRWRRWRAGRWTPGMALVLILLAWLIPTACRLATLRVKYLRYWEPLVIPSALLAAWALARLRRRRWLRWGVIALTAVWGIAYLWAFAQPHPHRTAARWLDQAIEPGAAVAFESWDERLGLSVPHTEVTLPSYDLPDSNQKALRWCRQLAKADWVVLTSNRIRKTILTNRDRFPRTARLYELLLSGRAGFIPLTVAERAPRLFGLSFPVQRADESFVNYEFPRVVILKRIAVVDPRVLATEASRPLPGLDGLSSRALEARFIAVLPRIPATPRAAAQITGTVVWLAVFALLALAAWLLMLPLVRSLPDAGIGLAAVTGWTGFAWLAWIGDRLGVWPATAAFQTWLFFAVLAAAAFVGVRHRGDVARPIGKNRRGMMMTGGIMAAVWLIFLAARLWNPAIFWGEKPMDFTFLNAFVNAVHWPPGEPWMAGMPLHYYAFGEVLAAVPVHLAGVAAAVGYNLMAATLPALAAGVLATLGLGLARRRWRGEAAWLLPLLVLLTGNLAWPFLGGLARAHRWFDLWWATSRVIPGFAIDEYPLWTALFADLHAHFFALPVVLSALAWGWLAVRRRRAWGAVAILGVTVAVLAATSPWDLILVTFALGAGTLFAARRPGRGIARLAAAAAVSATTAAPFLFDLAAWLGHGAAEGGFFLTHQGFAPAWAILRHLGVFLIPLVVAACITVGRWLAVAVPLGGVGVILGLGFGSPAAAVGLAAASLFGTAATSEQRRTNRLAWILATVAMLAVAGAERFTLMDRMNTLFKLYNGIWILLAGSLGMLLLRRQGRRGRVLLWVWLPLEIAGLVNLPLGIAQGWLQPRISSPRPTLDGTAYLPEHDPQTWFLVRMLRATARPDDVLAEAAGPSYREYTRLSMNTGLPTVLGWSWHLQQRGQSLTEIEARAAALRTLYASNDPASGRAVLKRYHIRFIALGDLERRTYRITVSDPFAGLGCVHPLAGRDGAALFLVVPPGCGTIGL